MAKMKFTAILKAKDGMQCLINQLKYNRAAEFMRAYEQQGPWPDMLSEWDLTYSLLLYPLPRGITDSLRGGLHLACLEYKHISLF